MEQQPTRRGPQIFGPEDENNALAPVRKAAHNKSRSLKIMHPAAPAGIKAPAKRAFGGDISNTNKAKSSYADFVVAQKQNVEIVKPAMQKDKISAILRPAQLPANNAASSVLLDLTSEPPTIPLATKPVLPLKLAPSKKVTAIYKDPDVEGASVINTLPAPVGEHSGPAPQDQGPPLSQTHPGLGHEERKYVNAHHDPSEFTLGGDPAPEDAPEQQAGELAEKCQIYTEAQESGDAVDVDQNRGDYQEKTTLPEAAQLSSPDLSQYGDDAINEEDYAVNEEEYDGYTTAHSYVSRGETTGVTTLFAPKITAAVKKELAAAKLFVESARTIEEVEDEAWDTSMVAEYGEEIFGYMRDLESKMLPDANYMDNQTEIQWSMRSVLMDWLIQVHHRFTLLPETLFLCVNYIDRFLSCKIVSLGKLQLVGATAIFVAAKYEEINCPSINEIVYMVDGGYSVDEILKAERFMLSMLQFELGWPGPMSFLRRISKADDYDLETRTLAKYFLEITIMDERFVSSPPSYVAAGAHSLARFMLKKGDWSPAHVYYAGYTWSQLRPLVVLIVECCESPLKHHAAVFEKYSDRRYKRASHFVQSELIRGFRVPAVAARQSLPSDGRSTFHGSKN